MLLMCAISNPLLLSRARWKRSVDSAHHGARWGQKAGVLVCKEIKFSWDGKKEAAAAEIILSSHQHHTLLHSPLDSGCNFPTFLTSLSVWHVCNTAGECLRENIKYVNNAWTNTEAYIGCTPAVFARMSKTRTFWLEKGIFQAFSSKRVPSCDQSTLQKKKKKNPHADLRSHLTTIITIRPGSHGSFSNNLCTSDTPPGFWPCESGRHKWRCELGASKIHSCLLIPRTPHLNRSVVLTERRFHTWADLRVYVDHVVLCSLPSVWF